MTGSLEAKRPHADFSTALWVWYQEGSHLYKQRWSFLLSVYKSAKTVFFFFSWQSWWKCHPGIFSFLIFITEYIKSSSGLFIFLIFKNSSVQKTLRQTASTIYCHRHLWSGQILPQSPSEQLKWVWSSLESERIFSRFHPASLCIWFWARRGGSGSGPAGCAGTAGGARLPQRYSLLHWDSRWIQSHCQARVGGLSP